MHVTHTPSLKVSCLKSAFKQAFFVQYLQIEDRIITTNGNEDTLDLLLLFCVNYRVFGEVYRVASMHRVTHQLNYPRNLDFQSFFENVPIQ